MCVLGEQMADRSPSKDTAPRIGGIKATSKARRACGAALTPPAARTAMGRGGSKIDGAMAHQD